MNVNSRRKPDPDQPAAAAAAGGASHGDEQQIEQALRWRLVLGRFSDSWLSFDRARELGAEPAPEQDEGSGAADAGASDLVSLLAEAERLEQSLHYIYDREHTERAHRTATGKGGSGLSVPLWIKGVRSLFPREAVDVLERDALTRYGLTELITDPEVLRQAEPSEDLLKAILQLKHLMEGEVLEAARQLVREVVDQLADKLLSDCHAALHGVVDPQRRPPLRTFANTDWKRTIVKNLKHYDTGRQRLIADRIYYKHKQRKRNAWRIIVAVDQSGSMTDSLIHSSVMTAILATLPAVKTHLILWDDRYVDVSDICRDPLEVLMSCQLGGGTKLLPAMQHCASLITEPERTILALLSDWFIWSERQQCLALAHELHEAGVTCLGLNALDATCRPIYDEKFARDLAGCGWLVASLTPKQLAEHIGKILA